MACEKRKRKEWSCRELRVIQAEIDQIPAEIQNEFDEKFDFWKKQWSEIPFVFSSNTNDFKDAPGWNALLGMGEEMLPLLLQKLCDEENFPALVLYEAIQNNKDLIVDPMEDWLAGEQTRAIRVVEKWIAMAEDKKASESS